MNKGCYHEILNFNGTYADINGDVGVQSSLLNSVADCFNPSNVGTAIGHPQGIDKSKYITDDQIVDLRTSAINGLPNHSREISKDISGEIRGYEDVVTPLVLTCGDVQQFTNVLDVVPGGITIGTSNEVYAYNLTQKSEVTGVQLIYGYSSSATFRLTGGTPMSSGDKILLQFIGKAKAYLDLHLLKKYSGKLPYQTSLATKLYGNPSDYPSMITDQLSAGKPVLLSPAIVSDD